MNNRIIDTDSYKASHWVQYPKGTTSTFSYLESRGSERGYEETVFFGLQYILNEYFKEPFTMEEIQEANEVINAHGEPFNLAGWLHILRDHKGKLPLRIRAVPEGTVVPTHNVLMTVETTCDCGKCYWVASYFETAFMRIWYPITVATQSYYLRNLIYAYLKETADNPDEEIKFKLHDFGSRGVSSQESAAIGGAAHLVNFMGTDTMQALMLLRKHYDAPMAGFSIPAGEHSTFSSWGKDHEVDAYRNMLKHYGTQGAMLAVVSDTWDIYNACENIWGDTLKQEVIDSGATVVIRPDSGEPVEVVSKVIDILAKKFGTTINNKGYKVLNNVRIIQGDGVNPHSIEQILHMLMEKDYSASNIAFGMGGALLQKVDRDTLKFAYKCSSAMIDGKEQDVYKDPVTDAGKRSKRGRLDLIQIKGYEPATARLTVGDIEREHSIMQTVYENGEILVRDDFETIRARALKRCISSPTIEV